MEFDILNDGSSGGSSGGGLLAGLGTALGGPIGGLAIGGITTLIQQKRAQDLAASERKRVARERARMRVANKNIADKAALQRFPETGIAVPDLFAGQNIQIAKDGGAVPINLRPLQGGKFKALTDGVYLAKGRSHKKGGIKGDTNNDNIADLELENDELYFEMKDGGFIVNKDTSKKYAKSFRALKDDNSVIGRRTKERLMDRAIAENEQRKGEKMMKNYKLGGFLPYYKMGGKLPKYQDGNPVNPYDAYMYPMPDSMAVRADRIPPQGFGPSTMRVPQGPSAGLQLRRQLNDRIQEQRIAAGDYSSFGEIHTGPTLRGTQILSQPMGNETGFQLGEDASALYPSSGGFNEAVWSAGTGTGTNRGYEKQTPPLTDYMKQSMIMYPGQKAPAARTSKQPGLWWDKNTGGGEQQTQNTAGNNTGNTGNTGKELPYQTWQRIMKTPWSEGRALTGGNAAKNLELQKKLLSGWKPGDDESAASDTRTTPRGASNGVPQIDKSSSLYQDPSFRFLQGKYARTGFDEAPTTDTSNRSGSGEVTPGEFIGGILKGAVPFIGDMINLNMTKNTPKVPFPTLQDPINLKTEINTRPLEHQIRSEGRRVQNALAANVSDPSRLTAASMLGQSQTQQQLNRVGMQKQEIETSLANDETKINYSNMARNLAKGDAYAMQNHMRDLGIQARTSKIVAGMAEKAQGIMRDQELSRNDLMGFMMIAKALDTEGVISYNLLESMGFNPRVLRRASKILKNEGLLKEE